MLVLYLPYCQVQYLREIGYSSKHVTGLKSNTWGQKKLSLISGYLKFQRWYKYNTHKARGCAYLHLNTNKIFKKKIHHS